MKQRETNRENKFIVSKYLPLRPFIAINILGLIVVRKENLHLYRNELKRHEKIHTIQMVETLFIGFYIWYFSEWIVRLICSAFKHGFSVFKQGTKAYSSILFEREAYSHQNDPNYLSSRKPFEYRWLRNTKL